MIKRLARRKELSVGGGGRGGRIAWPDEYTLSMDAGQTQRVDLVRSSGQSVRGEVAGITGTSALGAYIYAYSDNTTNDTAAMVTRQRPLDAMTCGTDGLFQTARLEPGPYTVVALAFKEPTVHSHTGQPDYIGTAKVIVTADAPPPPVKIELLPYRSSN